MTKLSGASRGRRRCKHARWTAVVVLIFIVSTACAAEITRDGEGSAPQTTTQRGTPSESSDEPAAGGGGGSVDDEGPVGSAGQALLSPANPAVAIEVDRSPKARLEVDPRQVLGEQLRKHGAKKSVVAGDDGQAPAQEVYSAADLRSITDSARQTQSKAAQPSIYVLVLEGRYENDQVTGVAFAATAFAIFPGQVSGGLLGTTPDAFETAVLVHELGHLFGLVDLTGEGAFHEDPQHPGHSNSDGSVMYWAVEDISIANVFRGGPPQQFDAADREEMSRIRD